MSTYSREMCVRCQLVDNDGDCITDLLIDSNQDTTILSAEERSDADWMQEYIENYLDVAEFCQEHSLPAQRPLYVTFRARMRGWFSGWEIAEYDEELQVTPDTLAYSPEAPLSEG